MTQTVATEGFAVPPTPPSAAAAQNIPRPPSTPSSEPTGYANHIAANTPSKADATPAGIDTAKYAEFLAWQASQAAQPAATPAEKAPEAKVLTSPASAIDVVLSNGTSDPMLQSMTSIFMASAKGLDMQRALGNALTYGDSRLLDVAYIREVGKENADHLLTLAKGIVDRVESATTEVLDYAYKTAGGEAQWDAAAAAFNSKAPAHIKSVIKQMLDSGNADSIKAAMTSVIEYAKAGGLVPNPGSLVQSGAAAPASAQALSKADFQALHMKLDKNSRTYHAERDALLQRRALGKSLGR